LRSPERLLASPLLFRCPTLTQQLCEELEEVFQSQLEPLRESLPHRQQQLMLQMVTEQWEPEFASYFLSVLGARERAQEWQRTQGPQAEEQG
jgi:hypothetical protein